MFLQTQGVTSAIAALAIVLGLILLAARAFKASSFLKHAPARSRRLALRETLVVDRSRSMHIVQCDGREIILLTGGTADVVIGWLNQPAEQEIQP